jgi:hypothetical protein
VLTARLVNTSDLPTLCRDALGGCDRTARAIVRRLFDEVFETENAQCLACRTRFRGCDRDREPAARELAGLPAAVYLLDDSEVTSAMMAGVCRECLARYKGYQMSARRRRRFVVMQK